LRFGEQYAAGKKLPEDFQDEKELLMAMEEMKRVNADERLRAILEQREKEEHIRVTAMNAARLQGREEGIEKGIEKGAREERLAVARRMLSGGLEAPFVAETTGLPIEEVHRLLAGKV